jgi:hypothetical protein
VLQELQVLRQEQELRELQVLRQEQELPQERVQAQRVLRLQVRVQRLLRKLLQLHLMTCHIHHRKLRRRDFLYRN